MKKIITIILIITFQFNSAYSFEYVGRSIPVSAAAAAAAAAQEKEKFPSLAITRFVNACAFTFDSAFFAYADKIEETYRIFFCACLMDSFRELTSYSLFKNANEEIAKNDNITWENVFATEVFEEMWEQCHDKVINNAQIK